MANANAINLNSAGLTGYNGSGTFVGSSLVANSVLYAISTDQVTNQTLGNGQIQIGSSGAPPVVANITGNAGNVTVTSGAGTIDLGLSGNNANLPAFMAYLSTPVSDVTGDGTTYTVLLDTTVFDQTSSYTNATGTFTAPQTGVYSFSVTIGGSGISPTMTSGAIYLIVNGSQDYLLDFNNPFSATATALNLTVLGGTQLILLNSGDQVQVQWIISGGTLTADLYGDTNPILTQMSGYLVC